MARETDSETGNRQQATGNRQLQIGGDIADRLPALALLALRLSEQLPREQAPRHVRLQWIRSATSAGANYEEARAAESRDDFAHKVSVAAKEVREARYWARLVQGSPWRTADLSGFLREGIELSSILATSARTARRRTL
jgi:four helix bundle protein